MKKTLELLYRIIKSPRAFIKYITYYIKRYHENTLFYLAGRVRTDKGIPGHGYVRVYDHFLRGRRNSVRSVCEVGLLQLKIQRKGKNDLYREAPSLDVWSRYFPNAEIIGFDILPFDQPKNEKCHVICGDQGSREDLEKIINKQDEFDLIIEDGSHASVHQQVTLSYLFKNLTSGGIFFIEDLHYQPKEPLSEGIPKTVDLLREFMATGKWNSSFSSEEEKNYLEKYIDKIYIFDSLKWGDQTEWIDAIAAIVKK